MKLCCDLEVDVNGQDIFFVDKKILSSFSGKLSNLFGNLTGETRKLKVIFHDFPGGAEGFEIITRFCYKNGKIDITPSNVFLLSCAANFMAISTDGSQTPNLKDQLEKSLEGISYWTWSELLVALKQSQDLLPATNSSSIFHKFLDSLVGRLALPSIVSSPYTSSLGSDSSRFQFSCETSSTDTIKSGFCQTTWWFEDLVFFNIDLIEKVTETMISQNFDHATISLFLVYYQKSRFQGAMPTEKRKVTEGIINLLSLLDKSSLSCKALFDIFRVSLSLKISKCSKNKLESLIGSQLDQATLDDLLIPSPNGKDYVYDVSLVLRLLKSFLILEGSCCPSTRLKKVSNLMDLYAMEVAPDPCLKSSKFAVLAKALPDSARDSYDGIYQAMDVYLEVHGGLCEEEKTRICCVLNCEKLSLETLKHLIQNSNFPSITTTKALMFQQSKLESLLLQDTHYLNTISDSPFCHIDKGNTAKKKNSEQILLYDEKLNLSTEDEKLRAHLQGMQWGVMELEKVCRKMQTQMANYMKSRLPKLCS